MNSTTLGFNPEYGEEAPTLDEVSALKGNAVLQFGAPWCQHCQAADPLIQQVFDSYPKLPHIKIFDGKGKPLGGAFKVKLWPSVIFLRDGVEVKRIVRPTTIDEVQELMADSE